MLGLVYGSFVSPGLYFAARVPGCFHQGKHYNSFFFFIYILISRMFPVILVTVREACNISKGVT